MQQSVDADAACSVRLVTAEQDHKGQHRNCSFALRWALGCSSEGINTCYAPVLLCQYLLYSSPFLLALQISMLGTCGAPDDADFIGKQFKVKPILRPPECDDNVKLEFVMT